MHILLVDTDANTNAAAMLPRCKVELAEDALSAYDFVKSYAFDAIVVSPPIGDAPVLQFVRHLREAKCDAPILVLAPEHLMAHHLIDLLNAGMDAWLQAPYSRDLLEAALNALIRRSRGFAKPEILLGPLVLDTVAKKAFANDTDLRLTVKEYDMLETLALRRNSLVTKEMFLNSLYGGFDEPEVKIIDVFICKLRKKLREAGVDCIETVWGRGYMVRAA